MNQPGFVHQQLFPWEARANANAVSADGTSPLLCAVRADVAPLQVRVSSQKMQDWLPKFGRISLAQLIDLLVTLNFGAREFWVPNDPLERKII